MAFKLKTKPVKPERGIDFLMLNLEEKMLLSEVVEWFLERGIEPDKVKINNDEYSCDRNFYAEIPESDEKYERRIKDYEKRLKIWEEWCTKNREAIRQELERRIEKAKSKIEGGTALYQKYIKDLRLKSIEEINKLNEEFSDITNKNCD